MKNIAVFDCTCNTQNSLLLNQHNGDDASRKKPKAKKTLTDRLQMKQERSLRQRSPHPDTRRTYIIVLHHQISPQNVLILIANKYILSLLAKGSVGTQQAQRHRAGPRSLFAGGALILTLEGLILLSSTIRLAHRMY